jgi:hypothetical protein
VEAVVWFVIGKDEQAAQHHLQEDRRLGRPQQQPEGDGGAIAVPGDPADGEGDKVEQDDGATDYEVKDHHRSISSQKGRDSAC